MEERHQEIKKTKEGRQGRRKGEKVRVKVQKHLLKHLLAQTRHPTQTSKQK